MSNKHDAARKRALDDLRRLASEKRSAEDAQSMADGIVCGLLLDLGCMEIVNVYEDVKGLKT